MKVKLVKYYGHPISIECHNCYTSNELNNYIVKGLSDFEEVNQIELTQLQNFINRSNNHFYKCDERYMLVYEADKICNIAIVDQIKFEEREQKRVEQAKAKYANKIKQQKEKREMRKLAKLQLKYGANTVS